MGLFLGLLDEAEDLVLGALLRGDAVLLLVFGQGTLVVLREVTQVLQDRLLTDGWVVPRVHLVQLIIDESLMIIKYLSEYSDEEPSLVLIMRVYPHASLEIKWIVFHVLGAVGLVIEECVGVTEHGLLDDFPLPVGDVLVALVPGGSLALALPAVINLPGDAARPVFEVGADLFRDVNKLYLLEVPR